MAKYQWHFARPSLAKKYLHLFDVGLTAARSLFARRRMGKTEFLKNDFIPAAEKQGYLVVYANLWDLEIDPATALVSEFYKAVAPKGFHKMWEQLKSPMNSIKATGKVPGLVEASLETNLTKSDSKIAGTMLMEAMHAFDKTKHALMLIIDEAQVLAYEENIHFAHALRAALDTRKDRIKVIFAGSSETTLRKMFGVASEPFYNWAPLEPFELLGEEFVEAMVKQVNRISKYPLSHDEAMDAFKQLKGTPEFFRRYIEHYLINPVDGSKAALKATREKVFNDQNFQQQWGNLLVTDQIILRMLTQGVTDLYAKTSAQQLSAKLGIDESAIDKNLFNNALRRLMKKNILTKMDYGVYQFEDEAFADWVKYTE